MEEADYGADGKMQHKTMQQLLGNYIAALYLIFICKGRVDT